MKNTYVEPKITIVELSENDILLFSNTTPKDGGELNVFNWADLGLN